MSLTIRAAVARRLTATAVVRPHGRQALLVRVLVPTLLPTLGHVCAYAQVEAAPVAQAGMSVPFAAGNAPSIRGLGGLIDAAGSGLLPTPGGRTFRLTTRAGISETFTDNVRLSSTDRKAEAITQVSAGVQVLSNAGRIRGFLDYSLIGNHYASGAASSTLLNLLSTSVVGELVERRAYVDFAASITQQALSVFGTQSNDLALANANRTEVRTYRVSPYVRGVLSTLATYELRASHSATHVQNSSTGEITNSSVSALLTGTRTGRVNWSASAVHQVTDDSFNRTRTSDLLNGTLLVTPLPELRLSLFGGLESNDYASLSKTTRGTYGVRVAWTPTPRTSFVAERREGFFGATHVYSASHRMRRSSLTLSDVQSVYLGSFQGDGTLRTTLADYVSQNYFRFETDPARRQIELNRFFQANPGLDPRMVLPSGVLTSATSMQRLQTLAYTWGGLRDTLVVYASRSATQRLDSRTDPLAGDLASFSLVRQQGVGATLAHRLSPLSGLSATLSQQRNSGETSTGFDQSTRLRSAYLTWSTRINPWTSASVSTRHTRFEGTSSSYRESAVIGNLNLRF